MSDLLNQLMQTITLTAVDDNVFEGQSHDYVGKRIFGGQVLAQALMAASHTVNKPAHSLHGYFLRGGDIAAPVQYQVRQLRDGRSLSAREVIAVQYDDVIFSMIASFSDFEDGLNYQQIMPDYPPPQNLLTEQELKNMFSGAIPAKLKERFMRERHVEIKPTKPRDPLHPKPMQPKQANWLRIKNLNTTDIAIQQALLAFSSDFYLVGTGLMPHGINFMTKGLQAASIDHSIHFHRPFNIGEWMLYDMWCDITANAKSLNHGQFWQQGNLVATVQQEGLMRLRNPQIKQVSQDVTNI